MELAPSSGMPSSPQAPLRQLCVQALARDPAQPAIEHAGRWIVWGELQALADQLTTSAHRARVPDAASVVLVGRNRPAAVAAFLWMLAAGRSVRMVYPFQSAVALARELERLDPCLVVADTEDFSPEARAVLQARGAAAIELSGMRVALVAGLERCRHAAALDTPSQPQIEILTSGTTGAPKRFGLTHADVAQHIVGANKNYQASDVDYTRQPPTFLYYPIGNISGVYTILPTLLRGHRMVLVERFSIDAWRDYMRRYRPERASLPPAGVHMVLEANVPKDELAGVRSIASGAAPLDPDVQRAFERRYAVPILMSYGATEFGGPVASMTPDLHARWGDAKFGTAGRPLAGVRMRVVDAETGAELGPGQQGLLEVATPRVGPEWVRTSDLATIDEDGFLFLRGRADGAIMRGGFKLLPETIEHALRLHSSVSDAAVVGLPDERLGQVPAAIVQLKSDAPLLTALELEQHLREHIYATHVPAAWRFVRELPRTASFKVDRAAARRLFDSDTNTHACPNLNT